MAIPSRTARRLSLAVLLAAVIPLFGAIFIAWSMFSNLSSLTSNVRVGQQLETSLDLYQELAKAIKDGMRFEADAIAARESLRAAALLKHEPSLKQELAEVFPQYTNLVSLSVTVGKQTIAEHSRGRPIDEKTERMLPVTRDLTDQETGPKLVAVFATPRARFDELESAAEFVRDYQQIERLRTTKIERWYLQVFAALLCATMLAAVALARTLARGVTRRIGQLATATQAVGAGDLTVRVPVDGNDEITDLARAFNGMLLEVERSRARIEFLQRMGTWQEMARRLAHEIKNPLTPIQLAVQECHRKYAGDDRAFRVLLDTTLEIVEEEVGTLRRLVSEFSAFARLPRAELADGDLSGWLREQKDHISLFTDEEAAVQASDADLLEKAVDVSWDIPEEPLRAYFDKQMLHRVVVNVMRNAAQAIRDQQNTKPGHVKVSLRAIDRDWLQLAIDDDGPGIPEPMRQSVFDPYVTTKQDGTGLGLAIVKKIVMEHGGVVETLDSPMGGARIAIRLPKVGSPASAAVRDQLPPSSRRMSAPPAT
ncbi:MAG: HAMP domain-containing protein [Deltaproteobacteria bacterium]|nr:HAMP domain-containing protein [Deltaproteobacteria bacterium]